MMLIRTGSFAFGRLCDQLHPSTQVWNDFVKVNVDGLLMRIMRIMWHSPEIEKSTNGLSNYSKSCAKTRLYRQNTVN